MKPKKWIELLLLFVLPAFCMLTGAIIDGAYNPETFLISYLLFLAAIWFLYAISNKITISYTIVGVAVMVLAFINYSKLNINGTPLSLNDFSMADKIDEIAGFAISQINLSPIFVVVLLIFICTVVLLVIGEKHIIKRRKIRLLSAVISLIVVVILILPISSATISKLMNITGFSSEELTATFGTSGGLYLAYAQDNEFQTGRNTDSLKEQVREKVTGDVSDITPNVIFVMSESFFDVDRLNVNFSKDPIPNFHALANRYSSGRFVTSTYCGGTGFVEMEVLTGLCNHLLKNSDDLTSLPDEKYYSIPSISDIFLNRGYELTFLHSYNSQLYNREHIYKALGFHNILFDDSFPENAERTGGYISDNAFADEIIKLYENKGNKPIMMYAISMENHQPYSKDKFAEGSGIEIKSDMMSLDDIGIFDSFIHGLSDADKALGKLVEYFEKVDEPTVLVFWGDHLPNLNTKSGSVYESLGYSEGGNTALWEAEDLLKMVSTDYVIWDNIGLKKEEKTIGSSMFGLEIVERLNLGFSDYFAWLKSDIKDNYILYRSRLFVPNENEVYSSIPSAYEDVMDNYSLATYDIVYGENKIFKNLRK